jgi:hypothetical protein
MGLSVIFGLLTIGRRYSLPSVCGGPTVSLSVSHIFRVTHPISRPLNRIAQRCPDLEGLLFHGLMYRINSVSLIGTARPGPRRQRPPFLAWRVAA